MEELSRILQQNDWGQRLNLGVEAQNKVNPPFCGAPQELLGINLMTIGGHSFLLPCKSLR